MGDYLLMKTKSLLISTVLIGTTLIATELSWVDEQVNAIKPARKSANISSIKNPFVFLEKNGYTKPEVKKVDKGNSDSVNTSSTNSSIREVVYNKLTLDTVINSSIMVNGKWYKKTDTINGYKIVAINKTSVTLKKGTQKMVLSTRSKKQNLKFKNK
ncbi:hypothetical protein N9A28_06035 [Sulfurimonas sp.]|nr:hypothetical protein [Sulfurimonas sp.]